MFSTWVTRMSASIRIPYHTELSLPDLVKLGFLAAIWGASFIAMRIAVPELGALLSADLRILIAAAMLFLFVQLKKIPLNWQRNFKAYFLSGLFGALLPFSLLSYAAHLLPASLSALLNATCPLFGAMFSGVWLGEKFNPRKLTGLLLGISGVWILVGGSAVFDCSPTLLSVIAALLGPACFALSGVIVKHHTCVNRQACERIEPLVMAAGAMLAASLLILPTLPFLTLPYVIPSINAISAIVALAIFPSALAQLLFIPLIARIGPTRAMSVSFLIPLFSILWGVVFLRESIEPSSILGGLTVLSAIALVIKPNSLQPASPMPQEHSVQPVSQNHLI